MYYTQHYVIDWDKVKSLDDMKRIIKAIDITFDPSFKTIESIKDLVTLEDKQMNVSMTTTDSFPVPTD